MKAFQEVWNDLLASINRNHVIRTISQNKPNTVVCVTTDEIVVVTSKDPESVKKEWIEAAWNVLVQKGSMVDEDIPGQGRHRSSFIMALLATLEYVRYKKTPKQTLILNDLPKPKIGERYTNDYIQKYFSVGNTGGIRYSGSADFPRLAVITTSFGYGHGQNNPYKDRFIGNKLIYTGEGKEGDQELTGGNLALCNQAQQKFPLHAFVHEANDQFLYIGQLLVVEMNEELQPDSTEKLRKVYVFTMQKFDSDEDEIDTGNVLEDDGRESGDTSILNTLETLQAELTKIAVRQEKYKRNRKLVEKLKELYDYKCQLCNSDGEHIPVITMKNGKAYVEVHHIEGFAEASNILTDDQGSGEYLIDHYKNAIVLCVYHHKLLHHYQSKIYFDKEQKVFKAVDGTLTIPLIENKHL